MMKIEEVIILAGGLGTRLSKTVPGVQKCMAPVGGRPFLFYLLRYLQQFNVRRYIFSLGHLHENIESYLTTNFAGLNMVSSIEEYPLGTGGAIKKALKFSASESVVVINGDTFFNVPLFDLQESFANSESDCMLALKPMKNFNRYGTVELNDEGVITAFKEKQQYDEGLINGGIYVLRKDLFSADIYPEVFSFEKDYLEQKVSGGKIHGEIYNEYFIDIGIPEDYYRSQEELQQFI